MSDDQEWANQSLRRALQDIQDAATKPLHVEIERLRVIEQTEAAMRRRLEEVVADCERLREKLANEQSKYARLSTAYQDATHSWNGDLARLAEASALISSQGIRLMEADDIAARLAETLSEQNFEYNRKTNDLIERHAKQIEGLLARLAEVNAKAALAKAGSISEAQALRDILAMTADSADGAFNE